MTSPGSDLPGERQAGEGVESEVPGSTPSYMKLDPFRRFSPVMRLLAWAAVLLFLLILTVLVVYWYSQSTRITAPAPGADGWDPDWPPLPASSINLPVMFDLQRVLNSLEDAVPVRFGNLEQRRTHPSSGRVEYAFAVEREPFQTRLRGDTAHLTAVLHYQGRGWYDPPLLPEIRSSCGTATDRDDRPRALVALSTRLELDQNWILRSRVQIDRVAPLSDSDADRCRVTFLRMDMTDRIMDAARGGLQERTPRIDARLAGVDIKGRLEGYWNILREPVELTEDVWLVLDPVAIRHGQVGGLDGAPGILRAELGVVAHPRILVGDRPSVESLPLPPLEVGEVEDGFQIVLEGTAEYPAAARILTRELSSRSFQVRGNGVQIREVQLQGIGGGRLAVELDLRGDVQGRIYLVGTPTFDRQSSQITVPDLDFDVATRNMLVGGAAWLVRSGFQDFVRGHARWPVEDALELAEEYAHRGLNHRLSPEARLEGELQSVDVVGVLATREALKIRTRAEATLRLVIDYEEDEP